MRVLTPLTFIHLCADAASLALLDRQPARTFVLMPVRQSSLHRVNHAIAVDARLAILRSHLRIGTALVVVHWLFLHVVKEQSARRLHRLQSVQKEIERNAWASFFESFTMSHGHWLVSVDGEKETLPLEGIIARDTQIVIRLGGDISHHRRIVIDGDRVTVQQNRGVDEGVAILSKDGHTTRLQFRSPMPTELVDGIA